MSHPARRITAVLTLTLVVLNATSSGRVILVETTDRLYRNFANLLEGASGR